MPASRPSPPRLRFRGQAWIDVLAFGGAGGLLLVVLQLLEYRFVVLEPSQEILIGAIALACVAAGLWLGARLRARDGASRPSVVPPPPAAFAPDDARREELGITPRELEVLTEVAHGLSNRELAARLGVSENTVKTHLRRLFDKLGARRRTEAVRVGRVEGLLP